MFPADLYAGVDLIDPGGHRLLRFGRYFHEGPTGGIWYDGKTVGPNVTFLASSLDDSDEWDQLAFVCKACRDQGRPSSSSVAWARVVAAVDEAWALSHQCDPPQPRRVRVSSQELPDQRVR